MIVMMLDRYAIIGLNWNVNDKVELRSEYGFMEMLMMNVGF